MLNDDKSENHNTGVSDAIKKFLIVNLIKNLNIDALLCLKKHLIKKYFLKKLKNALS